MSSITPEFMFQVVNIIALGGWLILLLGVVVPSARLRVRIAGRLVPLVLSLGYSFLLVWSWPGSNGGFSSLDEISKLFASPWLLLAGWIHYLAFDLFVGSWVAEDAKQRGTPRFLLIPVLPAIFLAGPLGLLLWLGLRSVDRPSVSA